jgi:hypothetical protein
MTNDLPPKGLYCLNTAPGCLLTTSFVGLMLSYFRSSRRTFTTSITSWTTWTASELETLQRLQHQKTDKAIAAVMPGRTRRAVSQKRLALTGERSKLFSHWKSQRWSGELLQRLREQAGPERTINSLTRSFPQSSFSSIESQLRKHALPFRRREPTVTSKRWTKEEDSILYEYKHEGPAALSNRLQRTPYAIGQRLKVQPEQRAQASSPRYRKRFSSADSKLMAELIHEGCTISYIAQRMQRTKSGISARIYRLKLATRPPK